jgi:4a-hydroxytetrahydrobiopterin dehydratase
MEGMPRYPKLSDEAIQQALGDLPGWAVANGKLHRDYKFADFAHAFGFMATAAPSIEKADHHPEWSNVYNRVAVDLTTHDSGGITQADLDLAVLLEKIASKLQ